MRLGVQLERIVTTVTGIRAPESEIQEGDVVEGGPAKVEIVDDDQGVCSCAASDISWIH